ncbi:hypothetical protein B296_00013930 [Ensete ventricosum]|uniref:Uncharacterized protein n=1 Tax=Ensete ventricosum TaxID=4639 RepID=A0A426XTT2_ENSVE|nr:hypothetical protein B296_00013930 [Ensete ventricosum]
MVCSSSLVSSGKACCRASRKSGTTNLEEVCVGDENESAVPVDSVAGLEEESGVRQATSEPARKSVARTQKDYAYEASASIVELKMSIKLKLALNQRISLRSTSVMKYRPIFGLSIGSGSGRIQIRISVMEVSSGRPILISKGIKGELNYIMQTMQSV